MEYSDDTRVDAIETMNERRLEVFPQLEVGKLYRIIHIKRESSIDVSKDGVITADAMYKLDSLGSYHIVGIKQPENDGDHPYSIPVRRIDTVFDGDTGRKLYASKMKPSEALMEL